MNKLIDKWKGYRFDQAEYCETGYDHKAFKKFISDFKRYVKKAVPETQEVNINPGFYYFSGFIKKYDKYVYISISDVRYYPDRWIKEILIRTAKSNKDFTGGHNNYTDLESFGEDVERLFKSQLL